MEDLEDKFSSWDEPMEVPFAGYDKWFEPAVAVASAPGTQVKKVKLIVGSNALISNEDDMKKFQGTDKGASKRIDPVIYVVNNPNRKDNFAANKAKYIQVISAVI